MDYTRRRIDQLAEYLAEFASDNAFALGEPAIHSTEPDDIRVVWSVEDLPHRYRGFDRGKVILDITRATANLTDESLLVSRLSPRAALIVKTEAAYRDGDAPQEDTPCSGSVTYRCWQNELSADVALTQIVREARCSAISRRLTPVTDGTHAAAVVADDLFRAIAGQAIYGLDLLGAMHERATTALVEACLEALRRHAKGIFSVTLLDTLRDGEYGGVESYISAYRIATLAGGNITVEEGDRSWAGVSASDLCSIIGDGDADRTYEALQRLGAVHRSMRTFVIAAVSEGEPTGVL